MNYGTINTLLINSGWMWRGSSQIGSRSSSDYTQGEKKLRLFIDADDDIKTAMLFYNNKAEGLSLKNFSNEEEFVIKVTKRVNFKIKFKAFYNEFEY